MLQLRQGSFSSYPQRLPVIQLAKHPSAGELVAGVESQPVFVYELHELNDCEPPIMVVPHWGMVETHPVPELTTLSFRGVNEQVVIPVDRQFSVGHLSFVPLQS